MASVCDRGIKRLQCLQTKLLVCCLVTSMVKKDHPFLFLSDYWHSKKLNPNILMTILSTPATFRSWKKITIHNSLWHFVHCFSIYEMINILQRGFQNILQLTSKHISWLMHFKKRLFCRVNANQSQSKFQVRNSGQEMSVN